MYGVGDFFVRCNDGMYEDSLCCPYPGCHWEREIDFDFSLGDMLVSATEHLEDRHHERTV